MKRNPLDQGSMNFFAKGQTVNILSFMTHTVSIAITQLYYCSSKTIMLLLLLLSHVSRV